MGTSTSTSKQQVQGRIDSIQQTINRLKAENGRLRDSKKSNNSRTGSKSQGEYCKRMIAQHKEEIKNLQEQVKILKAEKARRPKNKK